MDGTVRMMWPDEQGADVLYTSTNGGGLRRYSLATHEDHELMPQPVSGARFVALSRDLQHALCASDEPSAMLYIVQRKPARSCWSFHPGTTSSSVKTGGFHPHDNKIFLLGFRDGTVTVFRIRVDKVGGTTRSIQQLGCSNELPSSLAYRSNLLNAVLLPLLSVKALVVSTTGLCRLMSFGRGARLLRTWQLPALPLCIAVTTEFSLERAASIGSEGSGMPSDASCTIAIACDDSSILLLDCLGVAQQRIVVEHDLTRMLHLYWATDCGILSESSHVRGADDSIIDTSRADTPTVETCGQSQLPSMLQTPGVQRRARPEHREFAVHSRDLRAARVRFALVDAEEHRIPTSHDKAKLPVQRNLWTSTSARPTAMQLQQRRSREISRPSQAVSSEHRDATSSHRTSAMRSQASEQTARSTDMPRIDQEIGHNHSPGADSGGPVMKAIDRSPWNRLHRRQKQTTARPPPLYDAAHQVEGLQKQSSDIVDLLHRVSQKARQLASDVNQLNLQP